MGFRPASVCRFAENAYRWPPLWVQEGAYRLASKRPNCIDLAQKSGIEVHDATPDEQTLRAPQPTWHRRDRSGTDRRRNAEWRLLRSGRRTGIRPV